MSSTHGTLFRATTFGESHGGALGVVIDGCPPGLLLDLDAIQAELDRRRPGQSSLTTARQEPDRVEVLSGLFEGRTLGSPLALLVWNRDADASAYAPFRDRYRPSHADLTTDARYGHRAWAGGGRASARETVGRVAAGAVARQVLAARTDQPVEIVAWVDQVGDIVAGCDPATVRRDAVEANAVRCPDPAAAAEMEALIRAVRKDKDTVGGVVRCVCRHVPAGLGAPVFDKLEAELARAMLSLPAAKGFESGAGFASVAMRGSTHNDLFEPAPADDPHAAVLPSGARVRTRTNHSGGIQGGISNGMPVTLSVAFKPVATIFREQDTVDAEGRPTTILPRGRHDPCVVPRAVPMVEAMAALVLCDQLLRLRALRP
ncbi:MAG: chorismate synthase [Alphaproteobacteria bacterium]|nr:chorismate synthase [Alphaproteobacteria bacterium]